MQALIHFALSHLGALCSIGYIVFNEFIANTAFVKSNSIGQMLAAPVKNYLQSHKAAE